MHIDDIEDRANTYDWLMQSSAITLARLAAEHNSALELKIEEAIADKKDEWQVDIADLADRIDAKRKDAADESRYAGMTDCF